MIIDFIDECFWASTDYRFIVFFIDENSPSTAIDTIIDRHRQLTM